MTLHCDYHATTFCSTPPLLMPVSSSSPTTRISSTTIPVGTQHSTVGATPHVGAPACFLTDTIHDTHTQLARGRPRTFAVAAARTKHSYLSRLEECDVQIKACESRDIQLEVLGATSECLPKLVGSSTPVLMMVPKTSATKRTSWTLASSRIAPQALEHLRLRRQTERDVREDSCGKGNIVFAVK